MNTKRILEIGGLIAGVILVAFGIGALVMSVNARSTVSDELKAEAIVGSPDMNPTEIEAARGGRTSDEHRATDLRRRRPVDRDRRRRTLLRQVHAHPRARVVRRADLRADGTLRAGVRPDRPEGHERRGAAAKDDNGQPVSNAARNTWVTETALATALNVSYMAEQIALFGLVVGIALLLSGIGFIILALIVLGSAAREEAARHTGPATPATAS